MKANITLLPGDGIGPEVVGEAVRLLDFIASKYNHTFEYKERLMGGCSIDAYGSSLTDETLADCQSADGVLLGAVGGPKWDRVPYAVRPEAGLLRLRKDLGLCLAEAARNGARLPVAALVDQFYGDIQAGGGQRQDTSSLIQRLR